MHGTNVGVGKHIDYQGVAGAWGIARQFEIPQGTGKSPVLGFS